MKLKCIGGERDGFHWNVSDDLQVGDFVKVPLIPTHSVIEYSALQTSETLTYEELIYRITILRFTDGVDYKYLVTQYPLKWSDKEAILHQFNKPASFKFYDPTTRTLRDLKQEDLDKINAIHGYIN